MAQKELNLINMEEVDAKAVDWLWYPFLPIGKISIVQGDPGEGKTTFMLQVIALLTRGEKLPFDEQERSPMNVIYQNAEDGLEDTIKPRLLEAGADCNRVLVIDEATDPLTMSDERLEAAIIEADAKLVVLDPIQAYLGADVDMHRANEIRPVLKRMGGIAERTQSAIVLIGHMNKSSGSKSTYRGLGSIDFQATARSVLIVGRIKDQPQVRVVAHDKSSLAPEGEAIAFELDKETGFAWLGHYDISVDDLLSGIPRENKLGAAEGLLQELLADGKMAQSDIAAAARQKGISKRVLDQAKKNLAVHSCREGKQWFWELAP